MTKPQITVLKPSNSVKETTYIPIGGSGEFGRNMAALTVEDRLYLIDSGLMFADSRKLGVSAIFNDISPLLVHFRLPKAYIITHGHEDHIGSLAYCLERWPAPVYIPRWAYHLVEARLERLGKTHLLSHLNIVASGESIKIGKETFEYIRVNHSIPDANALWIRTPGHSIVHSGDFKVDLKSTEQEPTDLQRLKEIGDQKVDLFICDSTNASRSGIGNGESTTIEPLQKSIKGCQGRVFITTFSSNLWRLINIISCAVKAKRKVCVVGTGMRYCLETAAKTGLYTPPKDVSITLSEARSIEDDKIIYLVSGSQAEFRSILQRMVAGEHRQLKIKDGDSFIFSSRIIPGNERDVAYLTSKIRLLGGAIITPSEMPGIHVSGHAHGGEIELMLRAIRPKHFMPVHGTFNQIIDNALNQGGGTDNIICENGRGIKLLENGSYEMIDVGELNNLYIEDSGLLSEHETIRERLRIGENGACFVSGVFNLGSKKFEQGPMITSFGLLNEKDSISKSDPFGIKDDIKKEIIHQLQDTSAGTNPDFLNEKVRVTVRRTLTNRFIKKPSVVSQIWFT